MLSKPGKYTVFFFFIGFFVASHPVAASDEEGSSPEEVAPSSSGNGLEEVPGRPNHRVFNLHLGGGFAFAVGNDLDNAGLGEYGGQGTLGADYAVGGPLALSLLVGINGFGPGDDNLLQDLFFGAGFRFRFIVDRNGALNQEGGNAFGNLWLDIHFGYHSYLAEDHGGFNIGLGYEFSLFKDFNLGPYGRFQFVPWGEYLQYMMFAVGIQISFSGQFEPDDTDEDGIEDKEDNCPNNKEDKDGFEDEDGCPDTDNDNDTVLDLNDKCPDVAGVAGNNGCPDSDPDRDGIDNTIDKCPHEAEDMDGFEDLDGCPDIDNDQDAFIDLDDKCPVEAEDADGFQDEDGCPDTDNDNDTILDENDKCPNQPETMNSKDDEDGCPDFVRLEDSEIKVFNRIEFAKKTDTIYEKSYPVLEEVAALLKLDSKMRIRIEGHTDSKGNQKKKTALSLLRAESVKKFLVEKGVTEAQLEAEGLGGSKPIEDNAKKEGRKKNARIEFHLVEDKKAPETAVPVEPKETAPQKK